MSVFGLEMSGKNSPMTNQRVLGEDPTCGKKSVPSWQLTALVFMDDFTASEVDYGL